jgi:hypothetical protein
VLLQFIPYYGQGDPSNDSIVRATLSSLSVEDIDSKDEFGNTLLLLACQYRCEDLVRIMLGKGADPNAVNTSGACCLHFACYRESASFAVAKVKTLLAAVIKIRTFHRTPSFFAIYLFYYFGSIPSSSPLRLVSLNLPKLFLLNNK